MDWSARLGRALAESHPDFDVLYHPALRPAVPPEYAVEDMVAVTFRLHARPGGGWVYVLAIDVAAALRLGAKLGLDPAESVAFVDSHERMHVHLQVEGVEEHAEEDASRLVDAVWLSLRHPRAAELVRSGEFGLVSEVHDGFWETLVDAG